MESMVAAGIKKIMSDKGLLQKAVAARAGFSEQQLSDMLNNRKVIRAEYLPAISKSLGVSIPEIYEYGMLHAEGQPTKGSEEIPI